MNYQLLETSSSRRSWNNDPVMSPSSSGKNQRLPLARLKRDESYATLSVEDLPKEPKTPTTVSPTNKEARLYPEIDFSSHHSPYFLPLHNDSHEASSVSPSEAEGKKAPLAPGECFGESSMAKSSSSRSAKQQEEAYPAPGFSRHDYPTTMTAAEPTRCAGSRSVTPDPVVSAADDDADKNPRRAFATMALSRGFEGVQQDRWSSAPNLDSNHNRPIELPPRLHDSDGGEQRVRTSAIGYYEEDHSTPAQVTSPFGGSGHVQHRQHQQQQQPRPYSSEERDYGHQNRHGRDYPTSRRRSDYPNHPVDPYHDNHHHHHHHHNHMPRQPVRPFHSEGRYSRSHSPVRDPYYNYQQDGRYGPSMSYRQPHGGHYQHHHPYAAPASGYHHHRRSQSSRNVYDHQGYYPQDDYRSFAYYRHHDHAYHQPYSHDDPGHYHGRHHHPYHHQHYDSDHHLYQQQQHHSMGIGVPFDTANRMVPSKQAPQKRTSESESMAHYQNSSKNSFEECSHTGGVSSLLPPANKVAKTPAMTSSATNNTQETEEPAATAAEATANLNETVHTISPDEILSHHDSSHPTAPAVQVEVAPGAFAPLRRLHETRQAIRDNFYEPTMCWGCSRDLFCIRDLVYFVCPTCQCISPNLVVQKKEDKLKKTAKKQTQPGAINYHGVGIAFTKEFLDLEKERNS